MHEDLLYNIYAFSKSKKLVCVESALYYYRYNPVSISKSKYSAKNAIVYDHLITAKQILIDTGRQQLLPCFYVFQAYDSANMLFAILKSPKAKKVFKADYKKFLKLLNGSKKYVLKNKNLSSKLKINMIILSCHMGWVYALKQFFVRRN